MLLVLTHVVVSIKGMLKCFGMKNVFAGLKSSATLPRVDRDARGESAMHTYTTNYVLQKVVEQWIHRRSNNVPKSLVEKADKPFHRGKSVPKLDVR